MVRELFLKKMHVGICLTFALVPDVDVSVALGQDESIPYIMSHDSMTSLCEECTAWKQERKEQEPVGIRSSPDETQWLLRRKVVMSRKIQDVLEIEI